MGKLRLKEGRHLLFVPLAGDDRSETRTSVTRLVVEEKESFLVEADH